MGRKTEDEEERQALESKKRVTVSKLEQSQEEATGKLDLLHYLLNPDNMVKVAITDLPLAQINPLCWTGTFEVAVHQMAQIMEWVKGGKQGEPPPRILLSEVWRGLYYDHRQSVEGVLRGLAFELARRQMELKQEEQEGDILRG